MMEIRRVSGCTSRIAQYEDLVYRGSARDTNKVEYVIQYQEGSQSACLPRLYTIMKRSSQTRKPSCQNDGWNRIRTDI